MLIAIATAVLVLAVFLALVPVVVMGLLFGGCILNPDSFDAAGWASADPYDTCSDRTGMVADVRANHLRPGMSEADVRALLGAPDDDSSPGELRWAVGCWIDCDWVVVRFGDDHRLIETYEYQD